MRNLTARPPADVLLSVHLDRWRINEEQTTAAANHPDPGAMGADRGASRADGNGKSHPDLGGAGLGLAGEPGPHRGASDRPGAATRGTTDCVQAGKRAVGGAGPIAT